MTPKTKPLSPYAAARTRREIARAEADEIKVKTMKGEFLHAETAQKLWEQVIVAFRAKMLGLPTRLAAACESQPRAVVFEHATELVHEALTELGRFNPNTLRARRRGPPRTQPPRLA